LQKQAARFVRLNREANQFDLSKFCFKEQYGFISDRNRFKVAVCSRRSGKTVACAAHLIHEALTKPKRTCLYITLSRLNAKRIIWAELLDINRRYKLGGSPNETELTISFPNESIIYLSGAKDKSEIEKFRGIAISLCYIDECQSFREYIEDLINDVIGPALMDYAGMLCLIGTPGPLPSGFFHECSVNSDHWSKHHWTFWNNPHIALKSGSTHQDILSAELNRRGIDASAPSIQREWFGQWVLDSDSLLIHYDKEINDYDQLPPANYNYILGIDVGFEDADALSIIAWSETTKITYLVEEIITARQGLTELAEQIERLKGRYSISKMVIDEGGLGKKLAEELRRRFHLPLQPADKLRKMENVALLNDCLRSGSFKARANSAFAMDSYLVEIDRDKTTPDRIRVKDNYHSDIIDAVLYAFKESPAFTYRTPILKPKYGTPEWAQNEVTEMERSAIEHFETIEEMGKWN
jgi:hypothetical protein